MAPAGSRLLSWFAVYIVLLALVLLSPARTAWSAEPGAPPEVGIRLLEAPTDRADDPRARSYIIDRVAPGTSFTRRVEVVNGASERRKLLLYVAPASIEGGEFTIAPAGERSELVEWARLDPRELTLEPGERAVATMRLGVPPDAAADEYYGAVVVERPAPETGAGVGVALRVGVRIYLSVGPGGEPRSDFRIDSLQGVREPEGTPAVLARVVNTGGRALDLRGELRLADGPGGLAAGPFPVQVATTLAPGQSAPVRIPLDRAISGGPWLATVTLQSGLLKKRAEARISFPAQPGEEGAEVQAKALPLAQDPRVVIPIAGALIGVVALLLLTVGLVASRRRSRAPRAG